MCCFPGLPVLAGPWECGLDDILDGGCCCCWDWYLHPLAEWVSEWLPRCMLGQVPVQWPRDWLLPHAGCKEQLLQPLQVCLPARCAIHETGTWVAACLRLPKTDEPSPVGHPPLKDSKPRPACYSFSGCSSYIGDRTQVHRPCPSYRCRVNTVAVAHKQN